MSDDFDVAILGGGVAGLAAARALSARDLRLVLVEGRDRLGGRILTREIDGLPLPIELGAEFIHGDAAETFAIADAASLLVDELPDDHLWLRGDRFVRIPDFWSDMLRVRRRIRGPRDRSFAAFLDAARSIPPRLRRMSREFVSGYHAADPARISALSLAAGDEETEGPGQNRQYRIVPGYASVVAALRSAIGEACEIRLSTIARRIAWRKGHVAIHCQSTMGGDPVEVRARAVVLAVPAAVLKAGPEAPAGIAFDPPLRRLEDDLAQLEAGHVLKLVFAFRERFWD
ncbi:MAG: FAD-dependent oxidoreductase, partial [Thermoanaerobaculia bacterium]